MVRYLPVVTVFLVLFSNQAIRADAFDRYVNPVLTKVPGAPGVKELKQLTPDLITDHDHLLPGTTGALIVVQTNGGRYSKLLVQAAQQKVTGHASVPILLIHRFVTYREGQERALQADGRNLSLFDGFHLDLDIGQVVPAALGGDLGFVAQADKIYAEPLGNAKLYLITKPLAEAAPQKSAKLVIGEAFEPRYFNGTYKLQDDGRRSGTLKLQVAEDGEVKGSYFSDKDGRKYEVVGKLGSVKHAIDFTIKFPRSEQVFHGWLFTGDGKALTGYSRLQEREGGFYAVRTEE
jgi:hypothetical protein